MMGDIIVLAALGAIVAMVIRSMWKNHKQGKSCGCSGQCGGCCSSEYSCKTNQQ